MRVAPGMTRGLTQVRCTFQTLAQSETPLPADPHSGVAPLCQHSAEHLLQGDLQGQGHVEYLLSPCEDADGDLVFSGYERIVGRLNGVLGSLVVHHEGVISPVLGLSGALSVVPGSGTDGFEGASGDGTVMAMGSGQSGEYLLFLRWDASPCRA